MYIIEKVDGKNVTKEKAHKKERAEKGKQNMKNSTGAKDKATRH
jgi:hypothetical protein